MTTDVGSSLATLQYYASIEIGTPPRKTDADAKQASADVTY